MFIVFPRFLDFVSPDGEVLVIARGCLRAEKVMLLAALVFLRKTQRLVSFGVRAKLNKLCSWLERVERGM